MRRTLLSWNVNGIRAAGREHLPRLLEERPWLLALQETKAAVADIPEHLRDPEGYHTWWNSAERKGYSGVGVLCLDEPVAVGRGIGVEKFDGEGRALMLDFERFVFWGIYFPNGRRSPERLAYKLEFYRAFYDVIRRQRDQGRTVVITGDFNTAHREIDLARPGPNAKLSGFLPEERALLDELVASGFTDTFRLHHPEEKDRYSYWDYMTRARDRNVGWRIDYFFIDTPSEGLVADAFIRDDVLGSDHCPVGIVLDY